MSSRLQPRRTSTEAAPEAERAAFLARVEALKATYAEMSDTYQSHKTDTEIPLN